jgi:hypothetical protein
MSDSKDSADQRALLLMVLAEAGFLSNTVAASDLKLLTGGFWNQVYRLQVGEALLVIKQFFKGVTNPMFPVMPDTEAAALRYLQGSACAPEPIAYLPQTPAGDISCMAMSRVCRGNSTPRALKNAPRISLMYWHVFTACPSMRMPKIAFDFLRKAPETCIHTAYPC